MDSDASSRPSAVKRLQDAWNAARLWLVFGLALAGITAALSIPISDRQSTFGLAAGDVAPQDILAPYSITYTSDVLTEESRQAAAEAVPPAFDPPDSQVARQQLDQLTATVEFIDAVRADQNASLEEKRSDLAAIQALALSSAEVDAILELSDVRWLAVRSESMAVLEQVMRNEIRPSQLEQARRTVPALVSIAIPEDQAALVVSLGQPFVVANSRLNEQATEAARQRAREADTPVIESYAAGETIVSRGEIVTWRDIEALEHYGLLTEPEPWREIAYRALLVALLCSSLVLFAYRVHPDQIQDVRMAALLATLIVAFTFAMQVMIPGRTVLPYLYPAATLPMVMAVLFGPGMGMMTAMVSGALAGYLGARGLELGLYMALSGIMGALLIGKAERLSSFFWAGLASALASVVIVIVFRFPDASTDMIGKATLMGGGLLSGLISASLAFGLLLLIGGLLGITTNLQLIELSRPDHPLLQFILRNAPGTYQHSLQVANLSEQAARAINANPLLTRVGALYHDAGKAVRPQFFIENQMPGQNIHEQLDPTTSASVILGHVADGLELARKYRLPKAVRDFIPEHHGRMEASYQYQQAVEAAQEGARVNKTNFTYPGPRPRSREAALLMLADGVEAKARAEMPDDEAEIDTLVRWVVQDRLNAGQLDRTDLTLKDLDTIRRSFVSTLRGIYHPRIRYQEPDEDDQTAPLSVRPSGAQEQTAPSASTPNPADGR